MVGIGLLRRYMYISLESQNYEPGKDAKPWITFINFNCYLSVHVDNYKIIIPTKCTRSLLLKSKDITLCNFVLYFCPYMFQPALVIFRGLNASAWLKLLLITIY
jgi:hypothetical protein